MRLEFRPLQTANWADLEALFGERGACGGCWCMWWRLTHAEFEKGKGEANRRAMRRMVQRGVAPGILAYAAGRPVGWCSAAPRSSLPRLARSRILKPIDDLPVWSVVCFFVHRDWRGRGVSRRLLIACADWVRDQGGSVLEGYPVEPRREREAPLFVYTGLASAFLAAGFVECARRSPKRPIMRLEL